MNIMHSGVTGLHGFLAGSVVLLAIYECATVHSATVL